MTKRLEKRLRGRRRFTVVLLFGSSNGRTKLTDLQVMRMRTERAELRESYAEIGKRYGIDPWHARKICVGSSRAIVGGPLAPPTRRRATTKAKKRPKDDDFGGYDERKIIRCKCGALSHPSLKNPKVCIVCANS